ncbi:LysE family translocator [Paraburkholderia phymatum]|uniref:Lysine exporter protein (LYSE/YGGA) n=1 Tax=Paraburkholderia phymatum (strain DSM 17167 / CIP 108236 / LMG 21445 / STM815) TaxID=391038 RepID=B2JIK2_PARP8|nr:LysE family translocator [Paraburkholderia phymatum]ACC72048.1 Lysine exporter protein (LYSE/YGGA) [Paraburkholderia phymatum STM815]
MSLHAWWLYVATIFVVCAIPGPNMLLMMTHGARYGMRHTTSTMAGCLTSLILMLAVSVAGLGVLLKAWPATFNALRLLGAAYLIWLGVKAWRAPVREAAAARVDAGTHGAHEAAGERVASRGALMRNGFLVGSSNPKAILFSAALLPQFIDAARPTLPQFAILVATTAVMEVSWYVVYAACGTQIGAKLKSSSVAKTFNRLTGGVFVGFGAMMALVRH